MSTVTVLLLCIQACLIQNVFSQCLGAYAPTTLSATPCGYGAGIADFGYPAGLAGAYPSALGFAGAYPGAGFAGAYPGAGFAGAYPGAGFAGAYPAGCGAQYGGAGEGNVAVAGDLPVGGNTAVGGQVPIMGAVNFGGAVPAGGAVSIAGNCACGCGSPYVY